MKVNNVNFKAAREKFTESKDIGVNASRKLLADAVGFKHIQRIIDYETHPDSGATKLVLGTLAKKMGVKLDDITEV
jgi:hypothetical protein